jgi:hypothetical protein
VTGSLAAHRFFSNPLWWMTMWDALVPIGV